MAIAVVVAGPGTAAAQPLDPACPAESVGCQAQVGDWLYRDALFTGVMLDSGWVPGGAPIQLRFTLSLGASTEVAMGGRLVAFWPEGIDVRVPARPGTGRLAINYGFEMRIQLRFDVNVGGIRYRWDGDIPVPGIPEDLRLAAEGDFDPYLLPPSERPFEVSDTTDRVEVVRYDALGGLISIPGVSGGIAVTMQGDLLASYQTERIVVAEAAPILLEEGATITSPMEGTDFGPAKDVVVHPEGTLRHDFGVTIAPILYLSFVGTRMDYPLVEIPIGLADRTGEVIFDDVTMHVPLPDVVVTPDLVELGPVAVGGMVEQVVDVENRGEAPLEVWVRAPGLPFAAGRAMLEIPPRASRGLAVRFRPEAEGTLSDTLVLETNDPDEPMVAITLSGTGLGAAMPDAGPAAPDAGDAPPESEGGCGCTAPARRPAARQPGLAGGALLLLAAMARRRRRRGRLS